MGGMMEKKIEYYILAGDKGMKKLLIEKEIDVSPQCLMIVRRYSKLGKLIYKKVKEQTSKNGDEK
jgi:hypothetical protein